MIVRTLVLLTLTVSISDAVALERLSVIHDGKTTAYTFDELDQIVGRSELEIPTDYLFKDGPKRYHGYELATLFGQLRLPLDRDYILVCADGYAIDFDARRLRDSTLRAHLAVADVDAGNEVWLPYYVGSKQTPIAPFYLTWRIRSDAPPDAAKPDLLKLPWPYALKEIREKALDATAPALAALWGLN